LVAGPWLAWSIGSGSASDPVLVYYSDYFAWALPTLWMTGRTVLVNARLMADALTDFGFVPLSVLFGAWAGAGLLLVCAWGVAVEVRQRRLLGYVLVSYLALVLVWPWPPGRFLVPIAHALITLTLRPLWSARHHAIRACLAAVVGLLVLVNARLLWQHHRLTSEDQFPYVALPTTGDRVSWADYVELFDWLRANTAESSVLASGMDSMLYLYTGRRAYRPFTGNAAAALYLGLEPDVGTPDDLWAALQAGGAQYIVEIPMPWFMEDAGFRAVVGVVKRKYAGQVLERYVGNDKRFRVLELIGIDGATQVDGVCPP
jgi:hypothetical protein